MAPQQPFSPAPMRPEALKLVRYAMLTGVLLFGAVAYWQSTHRTEPLDSATNLDTLRWVGYGMCVAAILGISVLRGIRARAEPSKRATFSLIGSALGEAAGLMGAVVMLLGGGPWVFALGVLVFLASLGALPTDPDAT